VVTEDEPHPAIELGVNGTTVCQVNLTGRATSVPFTRVNLGSQRTTTDNTTRYDLKLWIGSLHESATYPPA
jgi:hypothetical protein